MAKLEIKNISVETEGKMVVENISFVLDSSKTAILMGPNGSGKSSLLKGIFGHPKYRITQGKVLLDSKDITKLPTEKKAKVGMFFSMQYLPEVPGVTLSNFLHRSYRELSGEDISVLDFYKKLSSVAKTLEIPEEFLGRELNVKFSGGEKKLSEVLQMAILKPKFAFLDEIDSGVDVDSLKKITRAIDVLAKEGTGFLLITHYSTIVRRITPDAVYIMKDGTMVRSGGHELAQEIEEKGFA